MIAIDLVKYDSPVLKPTDTVQKAMYLMQDFRLEQLVVVNDGEYLGILSEDTLLGFDDSELIGNILPDFQTVFVYGFQHLYELLGTASRYRLKVLAVLEEDKTFIGTLLVSDVYERFAEQIGTYETGAIIEMSLKNRDYSLSEISRLIESEKTKITSSYLTGSTQDYDNPLRLTLKLNRSDISTIVATLERFGYVVDAAYASSPVQHPDKDRYDMLMKYLSI